MFEELRHSFRKAIENFRAELRRDDVPDAVDRLLHGMREELTDHTAHLRKLEEDVRGSLREAEREEREVATCLRRKEMAEEIGDAETARIAGEYAEKHRRRKGVLERKALALKEEADVRRAEIEEMTAALKEARARRSELAAVVGRTRARGTFDDADDLFRELDRMEERISGEEALRSAEQEVEEALGDAPPSAEPRSHEVEERLRELKRRMGRG